MAKSTFTAEDAALLAELGVEVEVKEVLARTPREERIIAGFEEIQRFVEQNGRLPSIDNGDDIFERIYATRLERICRHQECRDVLGDFDRLGLLEAATVAREQLAEELSDDELLAALGVEVSAEDDITNLRHVKSQAEKRAAEEIANRKPCDDFHVFKPLFEAVQAELDSGGRETKKFRKDAGFLKTDIKKGLFFILGGQMGYVADEGEPIKAPNNEPDARLRVIYANGTESDLLLRSMQRALYKDETSRLVSDPSAGPLFSGVRDDDDLPSGTIYVLKSKSELPQVRERRDFLHKIGATGGSVEKRIANADRDPTFLMAPVEIVATYKLFNLNRRKLETLIHRVFGDVRLDIEITDRFGVPVKPREWFFVPLPAVNEMVERFQDGTLAGYQYDPATARLKKV